MRPEVVPEIRDHVTTSDEVPLEITDKRAHCEKCHLDYTGGGDNSDTEEFNGFDWDNYWLNCQVGNLWTQEIN